MFFVYVHPTTTVKYLSKIKLCSWSNNNTKQLYAADTDTIMSIHKESTKKAVHVLIHMHAMGGQDPVICANPHVHVPGRVQASEFPHDSDLIHFAEDWYASISRALVAIAPLHKSILPPRSRKAKALLQKLRNGTAGR